MATFTHGECGNTWTGLKRAHCAACHLTFSTDTAADRHRKGPFDNGGRYCVDPADAGLVERGGIWGWPSPDAGHYRQSP